jgi:hypothetical protein
MALTLYSWAYADQATPNGSAAALEPAKKNGLPRLSEIAAPRGFLPEDCLPCSPALPKLFAAPRGFLPDSQLRG